MAVPSGSTTPPSVRTGCQAPRHRHHLQPSAALLERFGSTTIARKSVAQCTHHPQPRCSAPWLSSDWADLAVKLMCCRRSATSRGMPPVAAGRFRSRSWDTRHGRRVPRATADRRFVCRSLFARWRDRSGDKRLSSWPRVSWARRQQDLECMQRCAVEPQPGRNLYRLFPIHHVHPNMSASGARPDLDPPGQN